MNKLNWLLCANVAALAAFAGVIESASAQQVNKGGDWGGSASSSPPLASGQVRNETAALQVLINACTPVKLEPREYNVSGLVFPASCEKVDISGVAGRTKIRRTFPGTGASFVDIRAKIASIYGVMFEIFPGSAVTNSVTGAKSVASPAMVDQWGIHIEKGVTFVKIAFSEVSNNKGRLGAGIVVDGNPGSTPSSLTIDNCIFSGNSGPGVLLFAGKNVSITKSNFYDNGSGVSARLVGSVSNDNSTRNISITGSTFKENRGNALEIGQFSTGTYDGAPIYGFPSTPTADGVRISGNAFVDQENGYAMHIAGEHFTVTDNSVVSDDSAGANAFGIDAQVRSSIIARNVLTLPYSKWGIDTGGSAESEVSENKIVSLLPLNVGGSQNVKVINNEVSGARGASITVYDVEADGKGNAFPDPTSGLAIIGNRISIQRGGSGVGIYDEAGRGHSSSSLPSTLMNNNFISADPYVESSSALISYTDGFQVSGNMWNGSPNFAVGGGGHLTVPDIADRITVQSDFKDFGALRYYSASAMAGRVAWIRVDNRSANNLYQARTTTCQVSSAVPVVKVASCSVVLNGGRIAGIRVENPGEGYSPASVAASVKDASGSGQGATLIPQVGIPLPDGRALNIVSATATGASPAQSVKLVASQGRWSRVGP